VVPADEVALLPYPLLISDTFPMESEADECRLTRLLHVSHRTLLDLVRSFYVATPSCSHLRPRAPLLEVCVDLLSALPPAPSCCLPDLVTLLRTITPTSNLPRPCFVPSLFFPPPGLTFFFARQPSPPVIFFTQIPFFPFQSRAPVPSLCRPIELDSCWSFCFFLLGSAPDQATLTPRGLYFRLLGRPVAFLRTAVLLISEIRRY